jgi:hypothetical protein
MGSTRASVKSSICSSETAHLWINQLTFPGIESQLKRSKTQKTIKD